MKAPDRSAAQQNRRGFVRHCFGVGASLVALPIGSSQAVGSGMVGLSDGLIVPRMTEYERILSHTNCMHVLGNPRSWSMVTQGLHPFAPERVVVMRQREYFDRGGKDLRRKIDEQIESRIWPSGRLRARSGFLIPRENRSTG